MILREIESKLASQVLKSKARANPNFGRKEFGGLKGSEVLKILSVTAQVQALEETITCITNQGFKGSSYRDLLNTAARLNFGDKDLATIEEYKPHLPFFISSLGPHLVNVLYTYLSTRHYKLQNRVSPKDRDMYFSYYRTSTGLGLGLGNFSSLADGVDPVIEVFKTVLGFPEATNITMPQHLSFPELGLKTETSAVSGQSNIAACCAMALGPLLRSKEMPYAEDSIVNIMVGDSGMNEPNFANGQKMMRRHMYQIARHYLGEKAINEAKESRSKRIKLFKEIKNRGLGIRLAAHIFDNSIGISCPSEISQMWGDPLFDYQWAEQDLGMVTLFRLDSLNFLDLLQKSVKMIDEARRGPVMTQVKILRPGGHSLSNYYGLSMISESAKSSPIASLTLEEAVYHNNNDSLLNALSVMMDLGFLDKKSLKELIDNAQKAVIERFVDLIPHAKRSLPKKEVIPVMAYDPDLAEKRWNTLIRKKKDRDESWMKGHFDRISKTPGLRFKIDEGVRLPEDLNEISPIIAENFSLTDILLLSDTFRAVGEDIPDISPDRIDEIVANPGAGTGGINKATSGLQVLSHQRNPQTGRFHILDIGIDEVGIYALTAGISHALDGRGFCMGEIQFNDYDFGLFALDEISTLYQRSNGREKMPVVIRQTYGFIRGRSIDDIFTKGGAAGMYHSSCNAGSIANRYKGLVIVTPNTSRAVQMAYRNAVAGDTPTVIFMSNPVMRKMAIGSFPYSGKYLPLDSALDPLGTYYQHSVCGEEIGAHHQIFLTFGEYAPICYMVAERLLDRGIKALVVDYNYIVPRNKNVVGALLNEYRSSGIRPEFTVVSQDGDFGFGDMILKDLGEHKIFATKFGMKERRNQWLAEYLTYPTPDQIYEHVVSIHRDRIAAKDGFIYEDVPRGMEPMDLYYGGMFH